MCCRTLEKKHHAVMMCGYTIEHSKNVKEADVRAVSVENHRYKQNYVGKKV